MNLNTIPIAILGCGSLGESIAAGLLKNGFPAAQLCATSRRDERRSELQRALRIACSADNRQAATQAGLVVLAAKPAQMPALCAELRGLDWSGKLLVSVAAGLETAQLARWLQASPALVRAMPNTPAALQLAATGLYATAEVSPLQKQLCTALFNAIGRCIWIEDEAQMNWVTALSGSGPAYFFQLMQHMIDSAAAAGFPRDAATRLVTQTALGAAQLAAATEAPALEELIRRVRSPGGTTEKALNTLAELDFAGMIKTMLHAAEQHGGAMSRAQNQTDPA